MSGHLVGADDVEGLARLGILARMDWPVGHDDRGHVVLEQRGEGSHGGLVAGDDGDGAGEARRAQVLAQRLVGDLAADQRIAHLARAVADAVRRGNGVLGLHETQGKLARAAADAALETLVDRLDLGQNAQVALAVALGADDADGRLVNEVGIGAEHHCHADGLGGAARMAVDEHGFRLGHGRLLAGDDVSAAGASASWRWVRFMAEAGPLDKARCGNSSEAKRLRTASPSALRSLMRGRDHDARGDDQQSEHEIVPNGLAQDTGSEEARDDGVHGHGNGHSGRCRALQGVRPQEERGRAAAGAKEGHRAPLAWSKGVHCGETAADQCEGDESRGTDRHAHRRVDDRSVPDRQRTRPDTIESHAQGRRQHQGVAAPSPWWRARGVTQ